MSNLPCCVIFQCAICLFRRKKSKHLEQSEEEVTEEHVEQTEHDSSSSSFKSSVQNGQNLKSAATSLLVTASHLLLYLPALLLLGLQVRNGSGWKQVKLMKPYKEYYKLTFQDFDGCDMQMLTLTFQSIYTTFGLVFASVSIDLYFSNLSARYL